jgi:hypothetical protein
LYVYVSVCSSGWSARKSLFHAQRLVNTFGESAWLEVGEQSAAKSARIKKSINWNYSIKEKRN